MADIFNINSDTVVNGTSGNDEIRNDNASNVTILASDGNDSVNNEFGTEVVIDLSNGDDYAYSWGEQPSINGGNGNDSIEIEHGRQATIDTGAGNDSIYSYGSYDSKIDMGDGNDRIRNDNGSGIDLNTGAGDDYVYNESRSSYCSITTGDGNDTVNNTAEKVTIDSGAGNDSIDNSGSKASINSGAGNDSVNNTSSDVKIETGDGADTVSNNASNVTVEGGAGNDSIQNQIYGSNSALYGGDGNDRFLNWSNNVKIDGGAGDDSIANSEGSQNTEIFGGAGNDTIRETSKHGSTINGGTGNDRISLVSGSKNAFIIYTAGDGDDTVYGFDSTSTLRIGDGTSTYSTTKSGNDVIVGVERGKITLQGAANLSTLNIKGVYYSQAIVQGTDGADNIDNTLPGAAIYALGGNDTINNSGDSVTIDGGAGNDLIKNGGYWYEGNNYKYHYSGKPVTIDGGEGDDTIDSSGKSFSIDGGAGNDSIESYGEKTTIYGGSGNDTINNTGYHDSIDAGAGDDLIYHGGGYTTVRGGAGNDTFKGKGWNVLYEYMSGDGNDIIYCFEGTSTLDIGGANYASIRQGDDLIIKLEEGEITLVGAAKLSTVNINGVLDEPLNVTSKKDGVSLVGGVADDSINNIGSNVTVKTFGGNDTIHNFVGVSLTAIDAGAGNDYITNGGKQVTINAGDGNDSIYNGNDSSNVIIDAGNGDDFVSNSGSNVTINAGNGDDSVRNEGSNVTINAGAGDDSITNLRNGTNSLLLGGEGNDSIANGQAQATLDGGKGNDYIYNDGNDVTINGSTGDDTIQNNGLAGYGDNVIFQYKASDGNDVVQGFKANSTLSIAGGVPASTTKSGNDVIVTVGDGKITLQGAASLSTVNIVETPVNINNSYGNKTVTATNANDTIINTGSHATISALRGNDSISNNAAEVSINAGEGNDSISNTGKNVTINPQEGDDNIYNNAANVTIQSASGNQSVFSHGKAVEIYGSAGKDTIENYTYSNEVIILSGAGDDSIKNAGNKAKIHGGAGNDTITSKSTSTSIYAADGNDLISLSSSYKNTVIGGAGDDTITLDWNSNNALIKHDKGDGNDVIEGFNATSTLQLGNGNDSYTKSIEGDDVIVTVEGETITLKGAAKLSQLHIDGLTKLNVNNTLNAVALIGGRVEDSVVNSGNRVTISTFAGKDTIENRGSRVTIDAGNDKDFITNIDANNVSINSGEGSDVVSVIDSKGVTVDAGEGSLSRQGDIISVSGGFYNVIYGNGSKDTVTNLNSNNGTILSGANNDSIANTDSKGVSIDAGDGNDVITLSGGLRNTIMGGTGADSIHISSTEKDLLIQHYLGDGNDTIYGFNENSTLKLNNEYNKSYINNQTSDGRGYFKQTSEKNNIIIKHFPSWRKNSTEETIVLANAVSLASVNILGIVSQGANIDNRTRNIAISGTAVNDTIKNRVSNVTINAREGDDSITNFFGDNVTIDGGSGNDTIFNYGNYGNNVSINGGEGNDKISVSGENNTINAGDGNDHISVSGGNNTINAGDGNDHISVSGATGNNTINAGEGDDVISLSGYSRNPLIQYADGDGNDIIYGFNPTATLCIAGTDFTTQRSRYNYEDIIVNVGKGSIKLKDAAKLRTFNIVKDTREFPLSITNDNDDVSIVGTSLEDTISNSGKNVTISAADGNDTISNTGNNVTIDGGAGSDSIVNDYGFYASIAGGDGNDYITVLSSSQATINAGAADDVISLKGNDETFIEYNAGDGNDIIYGFDEMSTLNIVKSEFTSSTTDNGDIVVNVGSDKITIDGGATLSNPNITSGTHITFTIKNSEVTCDTDVPESVIKDAYRFNKELSLLTINGDFKDYSVTVKNDEASSVKVTLNNYGSANLNSGSTLEYKLEDGKINATLLSKNYDDQITFSEDADFNYGKIQAEVFKNSTVSTKGAKKISFDNDSTANVTAPRDYQIVVDASNILVNDLPINAKNGSGTVTVEKKGLSIEGYGVQQFADLEIAKKSYFGKLAPMTVTYDSDEEIYTVYNTVDVKTLSSDFVKVKFDFRDDTKAQTATDEKYAYYKVNDVVIMLAKDLDNAEVVEVNGRTFKVQGEELDAEKIGRITLDEQLTFSGTIIDYDGVKTTYAQNKPVIYSADGKEITISDAATLTTDDNTKTFKCEAGSYVINGRSFETSADLMFTADKGKIKIPLSDAATEIYFDGVKVSGISDGGEIIFDLNGGKISVPNGATLNLTSPDEIKLNLAAGSYTVNGNKISFDNALELAADKDNVKVPLGNVPVTINGAKISGSDVAQIDVDKKIALPDGAFVSNVTENLFKLTAKNSAASFGTANKKVLLTEDGTAYIGFNKENSIGVGFNALMFEQVEILDNDAWMVETSGTSGIDKITGIKSGATITTSTEYVDAGDLRFEVETDGAGDFTICGQKFTTADAKNIYVVRGNSSGEIKVSLLADEFKDDDSEAAGKTYRYDKAGDYTVNGITFHAEKGTKVQTITRGVQFDLSTGKFEYDGLTLEGSGTAQINRYNASLISLTDGAKVSGSDESKYFNRQFEIEGTVELIGKKFESDEPTRCALLNIQEALEGIPTPLTGFVVDDKYVAIQNDSYDYVKVVDKKIKQIKGVKASAQMSGNGLANVSILTSGGGIFTINGKDYDIKDNSVGVIFQTDGTGNVANIKLQHGAVTANFKNAISINDKAVQVTGTDGITVEGNETGVKEISNVAGELVGNHRREVNVLNAGGAEKLTSSADGTINFNGNKFETSAGKTFELNSSGEVVGLENAQSDKLLSANVTENFVAMELSTTDGLEEVFGDFSEGLTVNGVFVKVTDSTNFVVKNDEENIYIETTAADLFTINGKTFETYADKTIFKLDAQGNVSEIVTDVFFLDEAAYLIEGDFTDEIIFNGKKFCVTGTNDTSIFIGNETMIGVELARNSVKVVESSDASEIAVSGGGEITVGDNTFSTSDDFIGVATESLIENFIGTISGKLGGIDLAGLTITTDDEFSATSDSEKITALDNLKNASFTCGDFEDVMINGAEISVTNSEEVTATISDGVLKIDGLKDNAIVSNSGEAVNYTVEENGEFLIGETEFKLTGDNSLTFTTDAEGIVKEISGLDENASLQTAQSGSLVVNGKTLNAKANDIFIGLENGSARIFKPNAAIVEENITLETDSLAIVEDTTNKISITASAGEDTIQTAGKQVSIDLTAGGATKILATEGRVTIENYDAKTGAAFIVENFAEEIAANKIAYDDGRLNINSATVTFAEEPTSKLINFVDANSDLQKVFFASDSSKLDASKETANLILVGGIDSTILGGKGNNTIFAGEGALIDFGGGKNVIKNFTAENKISVDAANCDFNFDGDNVSIKNNSGKAILESVATNGGAAEISLVDGKAYIAQDGENISVNETADFYFGKKSGVDFSSYDESLTIDLSKNFYGINRVTVGGGLNTLISSSANETLTSTEGTTQFIFDAGAGHDLIQNFNFAEDKISVGSAVSNVVLRNSGDVIIQLGDEWITLEDAQGKSFRINDFTAQVDKNISYDEAANYFLATSKNASVTVSEEAEVWLDGSHGKNFVGNIKTLDASTSNGQNTLAGNDLDNVICAGTGDASLWGGKGNDLLVGGKTHNLFFYTSGNDTIQSANDGDAVILSNVTLEQISSTSITSSGVAINFNNGGSLTVDSRADITYQLADGSKFSANHEQLTWQARASW